METVVGHTAVTQVVFVGPVGVGKTTAVRSLSDSVVASTDVERSTAGKVRVTKRTTTVGIDYGEWQAPNGERVRIVGTPGQLRFSAARESAITHDSRVILWLFGHLHYGIDEAAEWFRYLGPKVCERITVAVTRTELGIGPDMSAFRAVASRFCSVVDVHAVDPRDREQVAALITSVIDSPTVIRPDHMENRSTL